MFLFLTIEELISIVNGSQPKPIAPTAAQIAGGVIALPTTGSCSIAE